MSNLWTKTAPNCWTLDAHWKIVMDRPNLWRVYRDNKCVSGEFRVTAGMAEAEQLRKEANAENSQTPAHG